MKLAELAEKQASVVERPPDMEIVSTAGADIAAEGHNLSRQSQIHTAGRGDSGKCDLCQ
jgi:hypothetical protein